MKITDAELAPLPNNEIEIGPKETKQVMGIIESLEEIDDVQQVYSGLHISDEVIAEMAA